MNDRIMTERITLAHGNGGPRMRRLIEDVFARHLGDRLLACRDDAVGLALHPGEEEVVFTTDGYTVQPLEFPGGDIGALAVHGTVNDLAVCGATPRYLSLNVILEEGMEIAQLERIVQSMRRAALESDVYIATGDTKVVRRGEASGMYLATSGIGLRRRALRLGMDRIRVGDSVLVSGPVGDHGASVLLAREEFGLRGDLRSDAASVLPLTRAVLPLPGLRFMRDPTRGGLAAVLHEMAAAGLSLRVRESDIPVRAAVRTICEILGFDPYALACEGRVVVVVDATTTMHALHALRSMIEGKEAAKIGEIVDDDAHVILETAVGGERLLDTSDDEALPRIC